MNEFCLAVSLIPFRSNMLTLPTWYQVQVGYGFAGVGDRAEVKGGLNYFEIHL